MFRNTVVPTWAAPVQRPLLVVAGAAIQRALEGPVFVDWCNVSVRGDGRPQVLAQLAVLAGVWTPHACRTGTERWGRRSAGKQQSDRKKRRSEEFCSSESRRASLPSPPILRNYSHRSHTELLREQNKAERGEINEWKAVLLLINLSEIQQRRSFSFSGKKLKRLDTLINW